MEETKLQVEVSAYDGKPVVSAVGDLDSWTAETLGDAVRSVLAENPNDMIVDLSRVSFMDSGALQVLVTACRAMKENGRVFAIAKGVPARLIHMAGLDRLVTLKESIDQLYDDEGCGEV